MKIKDILKCGDREIIDCVKGIIVAVDTPTRPSEKQERADIHVQCVTLQDMEGQPLRLQIMKASMHITPDCRGMILSVRSSDGERGPSGLTTNVYQGKCSLSMWGDAVMQMLPAPKDMELKTPAKPTQGRSGALSFTQPSRKAAVDAYFTILGEVVARIPPELSSDVKFSDIKEITTCLFIEGQKSGWLYQAEPVATSNLDESKDEPPWEPTEGKPEELQSSGLSKEELLSIMVGDAVSGELAGLVAGAENEMKGCELSWDEVYDELVVRAEAVYELADINIAFDKLAEMITRQDGHSKNVTKVISLDWTTFLAECANAAKINGQNIPM